MSVLSVSCVDGQLRLDETQAKEAGEALAERYATAQPFPHFVLDDLIDPAIIRQAADEFPDRKDLTSFDSREERLKYQFHPDRDVPSAHIRSLINALNSQPIISFLSKVTGIKGLIPDPYFTGGGLHETLPGGHLSVHADFNFHPHMKVERRLNLLIYLNDDWKPEYGGALELWDKRMSRCESTVAPVLGRAVLFNTKEDSFHGHPEPVACPEGRSRRSIALYYYTAYEHGLASVTKLTTDFKARPGTSDKFSIRRAARKIAADWVPPAVLRMMGE